MSRINRAFGKLWLRTVAFTALLLGMKRRALDAYRSMVALDPSDLVARATVGNMLMEQGDREGATDAFLKLLEVKPEHAESWFNLGYIHEQRDQMSEAERCFRRALEIDPRIDRAWYGLGLVLIRAGRLREAVDALKENTRLQPFSPYGWYQLAMTYHHLGESGDAWRTHEHLKNFEPRYAATLKRDLENTRPRMPEAAARPEPSSSPIQMENKEAIPASS